MLRVRLTADEMESLNRRAAIAGKTVSELVREKMFPANRIESRLRFPLDPVSWEVT